MRGKVHILVHCPIDTLQWGSTHSAMSGFLLFLAMKTIPTRRLALGESSWNQGEHQNNFKSNQHLEHVENLPKGWKMKRFCEPNLFGAQTVRFSGCIQ